MKIPDTLKAPRAVQDYVKTLENILMDTIVGLSAETLVDLLEINEQHAQELERDLSDLEAHRYKEG